ncbi:MAG: AAA family ATPase, partial [Actinomycetota bacterium]|nr:AAA family ATPase [Actinomycetota bacterium]
MLSAIYIKGFKTFARPVRMPLDEGITVIVGPNGSGKSNITDAVLFALGEGSPGLLRAGSMGDLIFSGSDSLPPAGAAEVTLVLDNAEGHISLPYEEVSLTRRISRGGETEYRINGVRARLADVRAVAGEVGLGRHSILRQGAVDAIVAGGAAACRTALEEAAGLGVFRRRRLAASRKLERAAAQFESSLRLEAELSDQLRRIEAEAVAAREYREIETRYRELSLAHLYRVATQGFDERRERLVDLDTRVDILRNRQESLREEGRRLGEEEKELEDRVLATERVHGGLGRGLEALRTETLRAERALLRLEGAQVLRTDRSRLTSRLEAELDKTASRVRRLEGEIGDLEEEHRQRKDAFGRLEGLVARARAEHAAATGRLTRLAGKLEALREKRKRAADRLREADASGNEELGRLGEIEYKLDSYSPERLRARCSAVLGRLEELRLSTARKATEANRRRGVLAALVGKTEAEIRTLRAPGRGATDGKRLHEVVRPRPGYEAAVEAALGDLAGGVLAKTLGEGMRLLSAAPEERVVVRLDAKKVAKNGAPPGKPLLDCVEILDDSYAGALERLLGGAYVLEKADRTAPKSGYDVAVTREGLRFTRTSASRRLSDGGFVRQARLAKEEERLGVLKDQIGEELYDLQEAVTSIGKRLDERVTEIESFATLTSRAKRAARLFVQETGRRERKSQAANERRAADEVDLREVEAETSVTEEELNGARRDVERAEEELDAALPSAEAAYEAAREAARQLARARSDLQSARERRTRISGRLAGLQNATTDDATDRTDLARHAAEQARRLDGAVGERLARLRHSRSEAAMLQVQAAKKRAGLVGEAGDVSGELARAQSEAAVLRGELSHAEEARKAAESEIFDEWGATLETAREAAESLPETTDVERERARLARKLKNFGDVNLLAIGQEGALRERHEFVTGQRSDAEAAATEIQRIIQSVDGEIEARFQATFRTVRRAFASMVPRMMQGAEGELGLSEEGVEIGLKLRGRGWRPLRVLSGGERSLLALAFLFGIFLGRASGGPGTFCMLDEAEAALDDINLARFLAVVDSYRADGQFLLVTHQKRTMASADVLYGVTPDAS